MKWSNTTSSAYEGRILIGNVGGKKSQLRPADAIGGQTGALLRVLQDSLSEGAAEYARCGGGSGMGYLELPGTESRAFIDSSPAVNARVKSNCDEKPQPCSLAAACAEVWPRNFASGAKLCREYITSSPIWLPHISAIRNTVVACEKTHDRGRNQSSTHLQSPSRRE